MSVVPPPATQQYPTLSSGYTERLAREAVACNIQAALRAVNASCCAGGGPLKIQQSSGARLQGILDGPCYKFKPGLANRLDGGGLTCAGQLDASGGFELVPRSGYEISGISPGGVQSSLRTTELMMAATTNTSLLASPDRRFEKYAPYVYPTIPCVTPVPQSPIPVAKYPECTLTGVNVSKPNLVNSQPTAVIVVGLAGGDLDVSWSAGNDRSIVKYNVYVGSVRWATNVPATTVVLNTNFPIGTTGFVVVEPVARNNWRGIRSSPVNFTITI